MINTEDEIDNIPEGTDQVETPKEEVEISEEALEAAIFKKFGASSKDLIKKEEQTVVLSQEEKDKLEVERQNLQLTTALQQKWFTAKEHEEYQKLTATGKIEIARKKFIEDNPELGEKASDTFNELYLINEDDEIEEDEDMKPNLKKQLAIKQAEKIADNFLKEKYGNITSASSKFEQFEKDAAIAKKNVATFSKIATSIPDELEIPIGETGEVVKYKVSKEDRDEAEAMFLGDKKLVIKEDLKEDELTPVAKQFVIAKNIESILESAVSSAVKIALDRQARGEAGIPPTRSDKNVAKPAVRSFLDKHGVQY